MPLILKFMVIFMIAVCHNRSVRAAFANILPVQSISRASAASNPCSNIRNGQFVCLDCSTLGFCIQQGGDWMTFEYETCRTEKSLYCNEEAKGCTFQRECVQPKPGITFECQNPGIYPDPYDCKLYHNCNDFNEETRIFCPSGRAYSVHDKDCTLNAVNNAICKQAQYECNRPGEMNAWPGDANIYYVCHIGAVNGAIELYPLLYRCPLGRIFDGQGCIVANESPDTSRPIVPTVCSNGKLSPHESNCRAYYSCKNGIKTLEQCPQNTYFNLKRESCEFGQC